MFVTIILSIYFIITAIGIYASINDYNTEIEQKASLAGSLFPTLLFFIIFVVIYLKQIIESYFILWFIFDTLTGLILIYIKRNDLTIKLSKTRCVVNVISGIISCIGVLYILL